MPRVRNILIIGAMAVAVVLAALWLAHEGKPTAATPAPDPGPAAEGDAPEAAPAAVRATAGTSDEPETPKEALPPGLTEEEARRRRRLLELEQAAQARFSQTVELDGLEGDDVRPAVRDLFDSMTLEPAFDVENGTEGLVDGLRIAELSSRNPLAAAGFRAGDRLTRLDGQPLVDPAQIAYTMTSLGERFEVCADRGGTDFCRVVTAGEG